MLPASFRCLADTATPEAFAREVERAIEDFADYGRPRQAAVRGRIPAGSPERAWRRRVASTTDWAVAAGQARLSGPDLKARVFNALGFDEEATDVFTERIRDIAAVGEVSEVQDTEFGRKYTVVGELKGPLGAAHVATVWIQEFGQPQVRLVTVRPR